MRLNFSKETKALFPRYCMKCKRADRPLEDHHIIAEHASSRETGNSALNCCRICKDCHSWAVHAYEKEIEFLEITFVYLMTVMRYKLTSKDKNFLIKYHEYYRSAIAGFKDYKQGQD